MRSLKYLFICLLTSQLLACASIKSKLDKEIFISQTMSCYNSGLGAAFKNLKAAIKASKSMSTLTPEQFDIRSEKIIAVFEKDYFGKITKDYLREILTDEDFQNFKEYLSIPKNLELHRKANQLKKGVDVRTFTVFNNFTDKDLVLYKQFNNVMAFESTMLKSALKTSEIMHQAYSHLGLRPIAKSPESSKLEMHKYLYNVIDATFGNLSHEEQIYILSQMNKYKFDVLSKKMVSAFDKSINLLNEDIEKALID